MSKIYLLPCPECGKNNRVVMVRDTLKIGFACACYKCSYFGPWARTRRRAARKWNRYTAGCRVKSIPALTRREVEQKKEGQHAERFSFTGADDGRP